MSDKRKVKKINLQRLEQIEKKNTFNKLKKTALIILIPVLLGIGIAGANLILGDNILASRIAVNKMTCPGCVVTLKEVTGKVPGVIEADVSLAAQELIVKFYENKTAPEEIRSAVVSAGYPARQDALFKPSGRGIDDLIIASVNNSPVFRKDISSEGSYTSSDIFSAIGKRILLQSADEKQIVVQPHEIEKEIRLSANENGTSVNSMLDKGKEKFGSVEKYIQITGQEIGIRKLLTNHILQDITDPSEKEDKKIKWLAGLFMSADVKFPDSETKERLQSETGQNEWQKFWTLMISKDTELKRMLKP